MQAQHLYMDSVALQNVVSSWTRDLTHVPCIGRQTLNPRTTREALYWAFLMWWNLTYLSLCPWQLPFVAGIVFLFVCFFSSTTLLLPAHLPPPSCTHAQSCNPMVCSLPGCSVHGLFQARILEWVAISFSMFSCLSNSTGSRRLFSLPEVLCNELECLAGKLSFPSVEMPSRKPEGRERISLKEIRLTHNNFLICVCLILIMLHMFWKSLYWRVWLY